MSDQPAWGAHRFRCPRCDNVREEAWAKASEPNQFGVWAETSVCTGCGHKMVWRVSRKDDGSGYRGKLMLPRL